MERPASLRSVLLPREHGSWSLAFEPVALALLAAPTAAGAALAGAVAAGFLTRRPLKLAVTTPAADSRRSVALRCLAALAAAGLLGLVAAAWAGPASRLWPLLAAAPLGGLFWRFDRRGEMRAAEAELAGSAAFALLPATFASLAGWPAAETWALAALALARSVPTVLTVRAYLKARKGAGAGRARALLAGLVAAAGLVLLARIGAVPLLAAGWGGLLLARTAWLVGPWAPAWPATRVGMMEAVLGITFCTSLGAAAG